MKKLGFVLTALVAVAMFAFFNPASAAVVTVKVIDGDSPIDGASVTVYQEGSSWAPGITNHDGKAVMWLDPEVDFTKPAFAIANKSGYYNRYFGDASFWWEASPLAFDPVTGQSVITIRMVKRPTRLAVELRLNGAPIESNSFVEIPAEGGELTIRAYVENVSAKTATMAVRSVLYGPSVGATDDTHGLNKGLGNVVITLDPAQAKWVSFKVKLPRGLRNVSYDLRVEVERGWQTTARKYIYIRKGQ